MLLELKACRKKQKRTSDEAGKSKKELSIRAFQIKQKRLLCVKKQSMPEEGQNWKWEMPSRRVQES